VGREGRREEGVEGGREGGREERGASGELVRARRGLLGCSRGDEGGVSLKSKGGKREGGRRRGMSSHWIHRAED